jgi:hypothetical protein
MCKEKSKATNSSIAAAIGFFAVFALQVLMIVTHRTSIPMILPIVVFLGFIWYFLREKILSVLLGFSVGMAVILIGLFWWLTANGQID